MRERRPRAWWVRTVVRWQKSGLSTRQFAAREDLSAVTLRGWLARLRHEESEPTKKRPIVPLAVEVAPSSIGRGAAIEISVGAISIRIGAAVDAEFVAELVRRLEGR
jgi:hypothetical protein